MLTAFAALQHQPSPSAAAQDASSNADLAQISMTLNERLSPRFEPAITAYTIRMTQSNVISGYTYIQANPKESDATITVTSGGREYSAPTYTIPVKDFGVAQEVQIKVTAPDGVTTKTYTLTTQPLPTPTPTPIPTATSIAAYTPTSTPTPMPTASMTVVPETPNAPNGLVNPDGSILLLWNDVPEATSYDVGLWRTSDWTILPTDDITISFFGAGANIYGLPRQTTHKLSVRSVNSDGIKSKWSSSVSIDIPGTASATATPNPVPTSICITPTPQASSASMTGEASSRVYPKLRGLVASFVESYEEARSRGLENAANLGNRKLYVRIVLDLPISSSPRVIEFLDKNGITRRPSVDTSNYIVSNIPVRFIVPLSELSEVVEINFVYIVVSGNYDSSPSRHSDASIKEIEASPDPSPTPAVPIRHGADVWHTSGYTGKGVKIGILDVDFDGLAKNAG